MDTPPNPSTPVYWPQIFDVSSIEDAVRVIVTPEPGIDPQERWERETPFLVEDIGNRLGVGPEMCVLDYGCGIGRIAKGLIARFGCRVVGVDFSPTMRLLAPDYVLSERFTAWSVATFRRMVENGFRADAAAAVWVIQHVMQPEEVIRGISAALRPDGLLYALNSTRCVPTDRGWVNDGLDVHAALAKSMREEAALPAAQLGGNAASFVRFRRPDPSQIAALAADRVPPRSPPHQDCYGTRKQQKPGGFRDRRRPAHTHHIKGAIGGQRECQAINQGTGLVVGVPRQVDVGIVDRENRRGLVALVQAAGDAGGPIDPAQSADRDTGRRAGRAIFPPVVYRKDVYGRGLAVGPVDRDRAGATAGRREQ